MTERERERERESIYIIHTTTTMYIRKNCHIYRFTQEKSCKEGKNETI